MPSGPAEIYRRRHADPRAELEVGAVAGSWISSNAALAAQLEMGG